MDPLTLRGGLWPAGAKVSDGSEFMRHAGLSGRSMIAKDEKSSEARMRCKERLILGKPTTRAGVEPQKGLAGGDRRKRQWP